MRIFGNTLAILPQYLNFNTMKAKKGVSHETMIKRSFSKASLNNLSDEDDRKLAELAYQNISTASYINAGIDEGGNKIPDGEPGEFNIIDLANIDGDMPTQNFALNQKVKIKGETDILTILGFQQTGRSGDFAYFKHKPHGHKVLRSGMSAKLSNNTVKSLNNLVTAEG